MNRPPPPISPVFDQVDECRWVNQISGDVVQWCPVQGVYQFFEINTQQWAWWGPTRQGTRAWHRYADSDAIKRASIDFWVFLLVGLIVFAWAASSGLAGAGAVVLVIFTVFGVFMSYLHHRHPLLYTATALAGWVGLPFQARHS